MVDRRTYSLHFIFQPVKTFIYLCEFFIYVVGYNLHGIADYFTDDFADHAADDFFDVLFGCGGANCGHASIIWRQFQSTQKITLKLLNYLRNRINFGKPKLKL